MRRVIVVGGGAAGMLAAIASAREGADTLLLEKTAELGHKVRIAGGGRCNVTTATEDVQELVRMYPGNGRFLMDALRRYPPRAIRDLLAGHGVPTRVEPPYGKVFPVSNRSSDVLSALQAEMRAAGARWQTRTPVRELVLAEGRVAGVRTDEGVIPAAAVVIGTGGLSLSRAGCTGDGFQMARAVGHRVVEPFPSLVPLRVRGFKELAGVALRDVRGHVRVEGKASGMPWRGDVLFTHTGLSGPVILQLSRHAAAALHEHRSCEVVLDLAPDRAPDELDAELRAPEHGKLQLATRVRELLPRAVVGPFLAAAGVADRKLAELAKGDRRRVVEALKGWRFPVEGWHSMEAAEVTAGGVDVREVDPRTMASLRVPGLFWAGEVLDVDGYVGGYNFQAAWATGYLAGTAAGKLATQP